MAQIVPTKGNLLSTKKSLSLAKVGFELLDRKRNILIREMMGLIERANAIQGKIDDTYAEAYLALQKANITLGICGELAQTVPQENNLHVAYRSVMGVEIPMVSLSKSYYPVPFGIHSSNDSLDKAYNKFNEVKELTAELAEVENSVYRLANSIKKTQKRANALQNIVIPGLDGTIRFITDALEEKEREEFARLKVIKRVTTKQK